MITKKSRFKEVRGFLVSGLVLAAWFGLALLAGTTGHEGRKESGRETPGMAEEPAAAAPGRSGSAPGRAVTAAEPEVDRVAEEEAALFAFQAAAAGSEGTAGLREAVGAPAPVSAAVRNAIERLRQQPSPKNEVFALITVTDRHSGERRILTRGTPSLEAARYVSEPESAPPGVAYEEGDEIEADAEVEVAIRSIVAHPGMRADRSALARSDEEERDLLERNRESRWGHRIERGIRLRAEKGEIDLEGGDFVPVVIDMRDVPRLRIPKAHDPAPGGLLYVGLEVAAAREAGLIRRKTDMHDRQRGLLAAIEEAGGRVRDASWMSGAVHADVPGRSIQSLSHRRDVFSIDYEEPLVEDSHRYQGDDYFVATDSQDFDVNHNGVHGVSSKHSYTSRIVLALGEQCIDIGNPAWRTGAPGTFDRAWYYDCDPDGPCAQGGVEECSGSSTHGTKVAGVMTADFMDGQDAVVGAADSRIMTGTCPECRFFFLQDQNLNERGKVHSAACDLGVDIFESSISTIAQSCDGDGTYDSDVQSMADCDVHYVQSAGNEGSTGGCSTTHPGDHPWTFTVGGMLSENPCNTSGAYYTSSCIFDPGSSKGGGSYDSTGTASVIDQTGPYRFSNLINPGTAGPVTYNSGTGTSFSTPLVAGLMAEMMDWYHEHISTSIFYNNRMRNFMLLFGDRSINSDGASRALNFHSEFWGSGRVGLVPFDNKAVWSIRRASNTLGRGDSWNLSAGVSSFATFFKAVVWHDGTNYSNEPMIRLRLNPSGCATPTLSVDRLDSKAMLVYSSTPLDGCENIDITITNVGVGFSGSRLFHFASYSDTESERNF